MKKLAVTIGLALLAVVAFTVQSHSEVCANPALVTTKPSATYTFASIARVAPTAPPLNLASANNDASGTEARCYPVLDVTSGHVTIGANTVVNQSSGDVTFTVTKNGTATAVHITVTAGAVNNIAATGVLAMGVGDCVGVSEVGLAGFGSQTSLLTVRLHD